MQFIALKNTSELELGCEIEELAAYPNTILVYIFYQMFFFFLKKLNQPTQIGTRRIEPETFRRSTLPDPKPIPPGQPKWVSIKC